MMGLFDEEQIMKSFIRSERQTISRSMKFITDMTLLLSITTVIHDSTIGFAVGTIYQYALLRITVDILFKDIEEVPEYKLDVSSMPLPVLSNIANLYHTDQIFLLSIP